MGDSPTKQGSRPLNLSTRSAILLLKPVLRLFLRSSMHFREILEVLKATLVEISQEALRAQGLSPNSSRLSALSGLNRKEISRFVRDGAPRQISRGGLLARVMSRWENDKRFLDKRGKPRSLSHGGLESEFSRLVLLESSDLNPGTVLFELQRIGAAEKSAERIKFVSGDFMGPDDQASGWEMLAEDCEVLIQSVCDNLSHPQELRNHHLRTEFDNILCSEVEDIRRWIAEEGRIFHKRLREYLAARDKDLAAPTHASVAGGVRVALTSSSVIEIPSNSQSAEV